MLSVKVTLKELPRKQVLELSSHFSTTNANKQTCFCGPLLQTDRSDWSMFKRLQMWRSLNKSCKMCESGFYVHDLEQDNNNGMGYTTGPSKTEKNLMIPVTPVL